MLKILIKDDDDLKLAHDKYESFTNNQQLRWLAIDREKAERDRIYHEKIAKRKGKAEGRIEGLAEGRVEGLAEGLAEGRVEEKQAIAVKMLKEKLDTKLVSQITGLKISEIEKLQENK